MKFIVDPITFEKHNVYSKRGTYLLKNYVKMYKTGGSITTQNSLGGLGFGDSLRTMGGKCPVINVQGEKKYLAVPKYDELLAEENGENPILINKKISDFIQNFSEKDAVTPIVLTWILLVNPQDPSDPRPVGQKDITEIHKLVAVHNESFYEFSAKHETIISRLLSNEGGKFDNLGSHPFFASGEIMYVPREKKTYFNLQSGSYFTKKIQQYTELYNIPYNEKAAIDIIGRILFSILGIGLMFKKDTFITEEMPVSPLYLKKLETLASVHNSHFNFSLVDTEDECSRIMNERMNMSRIEILEKRIKILERRLESKKTKPNFYEMYKNKIENQINMLKAKIEGYKSKLPRNVTTTI